MRCRAIRFCSAFNRSICSDSYRRVVGPPQEVTGRGDLRGPLAVTSNAVRVVEPGLRVLIVDDDEDVVNVLVDGLTSYGHEARGVCTAGEALRALTTFCPQIAIIDISLVWTDGWALAEQIGALGLTEPPRLIALSGLADDRDRERSRVAGFSAHLTKPVRMAKLDAYLRGRGPEPHDH